MKKLLASNDKLKSRSKPKKRSTEIYVDSIFDGKQDSRQAFIGLMLDKSRKNSQNQKLGLEPKPHTRYNEDKVFSDVRVN